MAWRIEKNVIRGEIDNREKGLIRGRIWIEGRAEPIRLHLKGNACGDLSGSVLTFHNPGVATPLNEADKLYTLQQGTIGDLTASRKVRVFDLPVEEAYTMIKQGLTPPEHMSNSLYLEWFSSGNGRVVVESTDFELTVSEATWQLTEEEDLQRKKEAQLGFSGFMDKMNQMKKGDDPPKEDGDDIRSEG